MPALELEFSAILTAAAQHQVVGVGIDTAEVAHFRHITPESNPGFYRRCFSDGEIGYCCSTSSPAAHFAARFAAKEAAVKATDSVVSLLPWDFEVERHVSGRPLLRLRPSVPEDVRSRLSGHVLHVSLTHSEASASAVVLVCRESQLG